MGIIEALERMLFILGLWAGVNLLTIHSGQDCDNGCLGPSSENGKNSHVSSYTLSLTFNGQTFSTLASVLEHIKNFAIGKKRVQIYLELVDQVSNILSLGSDFARGLVKAVRNDKSWDMVRWSKKNVKDLLAPLKRHIRADDVGRKRRDGALSTINHHWGPQVTGYFRSLNHSERCLRQIAHFAGRPQISSYISARSAVNEYVVERLISCPS